MYARLRGEFVEEVMKTYVLGSVGLIALFATMATAKDLTVTLQSTPEGASVVNGDGRVAQRCL